jgi:hypothetical protein
MIARYPLLSVFFPARKTDEAESSVISPAPRRSSLQMLGNDGYS